MAEIKRSEHHYKIDSLCKTVGPMVLRPLVNYYLGKNGMTLKQLLDIDLNVNQTDERYRNIQEMKRTYNLEKYDITKLGILLKAFKSESMRFKLEGDDEEKLKTIKKYRNKSSHKEIAEEPDEKVCEAVAACLKKWSNSVDSRARTTIAHNVEQWIDKISDRKLIEGCSKEIKLQQRLTRGNTYVTDIYFPVFLLGNRCSSRQTVLQNLDIRFALASSCLVLDFDPSTDLLDSVEQDDGNEKSIYEVRTVFDVQQKKTDMLSGNPLWIFCNGYEKSSSEKERRSLNLRDWKQERAKGLRKILDEVKEKYSRTCLLICLVFENLDGPANYAVGYLVEDLGYPKEIDCLVISETDDSVHRLKSQFKESLYEDDVDELFIAGITLEMLSRVMQIVFRVNPDIECILPSSAGGKVVMTKKERSAYVDIDIVSGEECIHEIEKMKEIERDAKFEKTRTDYYRGKSISWWNFYFTGQVGKRKVMDGYCRELNQIIAKGKHRVQVFRIDHQPGAGGTTLGMHILWKFSQFTETVSPSATYRCCIVKHISENNTVRQIEGFFTFKENSDEARPLFVLVDSVQDDDFTDFYEELLQSAAKVKSSGLVYLVLRICSIPFSSLENYSRLLTAKLKPDEQMWFNKTHANLESDHGTDYINSLIAFNCLKESYSDKVLTRTTKRLMEGIRIDEKNVMKCLALIRTYEREKHAVPFRLFNVLMEDRGTKETWNKSLSEAMFLLVNEYVDEKTIGISVISQPLARAVLQNFIQVDRVQLESLVDFLFNLVELNESTDVGSWMRKILKSIVADLFKRGKKEDKPDKAGHELTEERANRPKKKIPFSALIHDLHSQKSYETLDQARERAIKYLRRCFDLSEDPFVGQQLARYLYYIERFPEAEGAIIRCRELNSSNSFLCDTHGVIFKVQMETLIEKYGTKRERSIRVEHAAEIVKIAFKAIDKFREGQELAKSECAKVYKRNTYSFENEIRTAVHLLESFTSFDCCEGHQGRAMIMKFLNSMSFDVENSNLSPLVHACPEILELRQNGIVEIHLRNTLQTLRDWSSQIKYYTRLKTDEGDLILTLGERLERFYGTETNEGNSRLFCAIDLQAMLKNMSESGPAKKKLIERFDIAKKHLMEGDHSDYTRDMLVYLGFNVVNLSNKKVTVTEDEYENLLHWSMNLLESELTIPGERLLLDVFLYFAVFHFPTQLRVSKDYESFCPPTKFKTYIDKWKKKFHENHDLNNRKQREQNMPTTSFAVSKGTPGNDIITMKAIRHQLKVKKGTKEQPPSGDEIWDEPVTKEVLESFQGLVNEDGSSLYYQVKYPWNNSSKIFEIGMYKHQPDLCNKEVTFFLGFSWRGPTALGVKELDESEDDLVPQAQSLSLEESSVEVAPRTSPRSKGGNTSSSQVQNRKDMLTKPEINETMSSLVKTNKVTASCKDKPVVVETAEQSREISKSLIDNPPSYILAVDVCRSIGDGKKQLCLLMLNFIYGETKKTFLYHFLDSRSWIVDDGELKLILKSHETVWCDIGTASECLISDYDLILDQIWDVQVMLKHIPDADKEKHTLGSWPSEFMKYVKGLMAGNIEENLIEVMTRRAEFIQRTYENCKQYLEENARSFKLSSDIKKETFEVAQPECLKEKIQQIKKKEKKERQKQQKDTTAKGETDKMAKKTCQPSQSKQKGKKK